MENTLFYIICLFVGFALACCVTNFLGYLQKGHVLYNLMHRKKSPRLNRAS